MSIVWPTVVWSRDVWPCPTDLADGEKIELEDPLNSGSIDAVVVDTINGVISVSIDAFMSTVCTIDPRYTKWRRITPKVTYGAKCADRLCPIGYFEHAEVKEGWKCRQCARR